MDASYNKGKLIITDTELRFSDGAVYQLKEIGGAKSKKLLSASTHLTVMFISAILGAASGGLLIPLLFAWIVYYIYIDSTGNTVLVLYNQNGYEMYTSARGDVSLCAAEKHINRLIARQ